MKKVEMLVNLYKELLITYSNAPNDTIAESKKWDLYNLFETPQLRHAYDLFNNEETYGVNAESYLRIIKNIYDNKILVDFENLHIFSCIANINGKQFALATIDKKLEYIGNKDEFKNKTRTVKILIGINITKSEYKINLVIFPEEYLAIDKSCIIDEKQDNQKILFTENITIADLAYIQKDFVTAKQFYEKALLYKNDDSNILMQLNKCNSFINLVSFQTNADKYLTEGDFSKAKEMFEQIMNQYPEKRDYALNNINNCDEQIRWQNYNEYKKAGDDNFRKLFYQAATENYRSALKYNPNDSYSLMMIKKCDNADKTTAINGIYKARELVSRKNKKYFPEIIKILTYYEPSGLLTGQDYYNLAAILDVAYSNVNMAMNYTKRQSYHLAKEYCLKSMAKGYKSADELWFDRFNKKARNL